MVKIEVELVPCDSCRRQQWNLIGCCMDCGKNICKDCGHDSPKYGVYCKECLEKYSEAQKDLIISSVKKAQLLVKMFAILSLGFLLAVAIFPVVYTEAGIVLVIFEDPTFVITELILVIAFIITFVIVMILRLTSKSIEPLPDI